VNYPEIHGLITGVRPIVHPAITSSTGTITVYPNGVYPKASVHINSVIEDYGSIRVGLTIGDRDPNRRKLGRGVVWLQGEFSNTFSGDVHVIHDNILALSKSVTNGAVRGDIYARWGGAICIDRSYQIRNSSTVTLDGRDRPVEFYFNGTDTSITEDFRRLVVKGDVDLRFYLGRSQGYLRKLYLDDLLIENGALLHVKGWAEHNSRLLVRKTSANLGDALKKIVFEGYDPNAIHLENYDSDFYEISGAPEPSTYGAALATGTLSFAFWRRKRKHDCRDNWLPLRVDLNSRKTTAGEVGLGALVGLAEAFDKHRLRRGRR